MTIAAGLLASSCSKESPFENEMPLQTGKLMTESLTVSLHNPDGPRSVKNRNVRMGAPEKDLFTVEFIKDGKVVKEYNYAEMPEIVTLPVGDYKARAYYGTNPDAAWESPFYEGETENVFTIESDKITEKVDPIVCKIANVRVSVDFDPVLLSKMGDDCTVTVVAGEKGTLQFDKNTTSKSGYFAFVEDSPTLVATFSGTVDGFETTESKTFTNVAPGKYYQITFRLHEPNDDNPGNIGGDDMIIVDASVISSEIDGSVDDPDDEVIEGNMRPSETPEDQPGEEDPNQPGKPDEPKGAAPTITSNPGIDLEAENVLTDDLQVILTVESEAGIQEFNVQIQSEVLERELAGELPTDLDLVNTPQEQVDFFDSFGFPSNVGGSHKEIINLSDCMSLLKMVSSPGDKHYFVLRVKDANGEVTKTLKLVY